MKLLDKVFVCLFCLPTCLIGGELAAIGEFNPEAPTAYYRKAGLQLQAMRFETTRPCKLERLHITLGGLSAHGGARVRIFGQEGGAAVPVLEEDFIEPVHIRKSRAGLETITLEISGNKAFAKQQFFVAVDMLEEGVLLPTDTEPKAATCVSAECGEYYYQFMKFADGHWEYGNFAYAIEAEVSYPKYPEEPRFYRDSSAFTRGEETVPVGYSNIACRDLNNDNYLDILANGRLYLNNTDGKFRLASFCADDTFEPDITVFIDADSDGDNDIFGIRGRQEGELRTALYINNGSEQFQVQELAITGLHNITALCIADVNQDGRADIFIGQCSNKETPGLRNYLLLNNGDYSFNDASSMLGAVQQAAVKGAGFVDINNDAAPDLHIARYYRQNDIVLINEDGNSFSDMSAAHWNGFAGEYANSLGCHWFDADNDGNPDLLSPRFTGLLDYKGGSTAPSALYANSGSPAYEMRPNILAGDLTYEERHSGGAFGDIDNDGRADFILLTSCPCRYADAYLQTPTGTFELATAELGLAELSGNRDAVWADLDNNGTLDLLAIDADAHLTIYRNRAIAENTANYITLDLERAAANASILGTKVIVYAGGEVFYREVQSGRGLLMQDPTRLHVGIGSRESIDSVLVYWPNQRDAGEKFTDLAINTHEWLKEGSGDGISSNNSSILRISATPNPFSKMCSIRYQLVREADISVAIYSVSGIKIKELVSGIQQAGDYMVQWDASDETGNDVATGAYLYHIVCGGETYKGKLSLLR